MEVIEPMTEVIGHECDSPVTVTVRTEYESDLVRVSIPVIDSGVVIHEGKGGHMSITRDAEVHFPITGLLDDEDTDWGDHSPPESWWELVAPEDNDVVSPSRETTVRAAGETARSAPPTATIAMTPVDQNGDALSSTETAIVNPDLASQSIGDNRIPVFRGYVDIIGSGNGTNSGQIKIMDPGRLLSRIPASIAFVGQRSVTSLLEWVADEFQSGQTYFDHVEVSATGDVDSRFFGNSSAVPQRFLPNEEPDRTEVFTPNRNTLKDVVEWVSEVANARVWFEPLGDAGLALCTNRDPATEYTAGADNTDLSLIQNNATYEIHPINALSLSGHSGHRIEVAGRSVNTPDAGDTYVRAVARYPPLIERADGQITEAEHSKLTNQDALEQQAKSRLKDKINEVTGGSMVLPLSPQVRPFDRVQARPACEGIVNASLDRIPFEVERATHTFKPDPTNEISTHIPHTEVSVSFAVDPSEIEVESTILDRITNLPVDSDSETDRVNVPDDTINPYEWNPLP